MPGIFLSFSYFVCMTFYLLVYMCTLCMSGPRRSEEGIGFLGMGVTDGCELPHGCRERNLCPLYEQQVLLIIKSVQLLLLVHF